MISRARNTYNVRLSFLFAAYYNGNPGSTSCDATAGGGGVTCDDNDASTHTDICSEAATTCVGTGDYCAVLLRARDSIWVRSFVTQSVDGLSHINEHTSNTCRVVRSFLPLIPF